MITYPWFVKTKKMGESKERTRMENGKISKIDSQLFSFPTPAAVIDRWLIPLRTHVSPCWSDPSSSQIINRTKWFSFWFHFEEGMDTYVYSYIYCIMYREGKRIPFSHGNERREKATRGCASSFSSFVPSLFPLVQLFPYSILPSLSAAFDH